jgi:replication factor A1
VLDVVGVLEAVEPWATISRRNGTETRKRAVHLRDDSGRSVELTLWGAFANNPGDALEAAVQQAAQQAAAGQPPPPTVVAVKAARVGDFNGKNVSTIASSNVAIDPPRPEADELRAWWTTRGGSSAPAVPLSERRGGGAGGGGGGGGGERDRRVTLAAFAEEGLGTRGAPDYVTVLASVGFVRNSEGTRMTYAACTRDHGGRACNKKLQEPSGGGGGDWWCERCQAPCSDPAYRYLLSLQLADHTGAAWVTAFGDTGDALMGGATAAQVREAQLAAEAERAGGDDGYGGGGGGGGGMAGRQLESIVEAATFKPHLLRLKAAVETWNDEARLKVSVVRATPPDWAQESRVLLGQIARLERGEDPYGAAPPAGAGGVASPPGAAARGGGGAPMAVTPAGGGGWQHGPPPQQQQNPYGGGYGGPPPPQHQQQYGGPPPPQQPYGGGGYGGGPGAGGAPPPSYAPPPQYGGPPPPQQQQQGGYYQQPPPPPPQQQQQQQQQGGAAAASHPFAAGWA